MDLTYSIVVIQGFPQTRPVRFWTSACYSGGAMATNAQILANRNNAQLSSGPRTPEGKAVAARNSLQHGLASASVLVLPHEDQAEFDSLTQRLTAEFRPKGEHETFLVRQMIKARWNLARIERLEQLAFEQILTEPDGDSDPDARILAALSGSGSGNPLDKLARYQAAAERSYYKAHRELTQARKQKLQNEAKSLDAALYRYINAGMPNDPISSRKETRAKAPVPNEPNHRVATPPDILRRHPSQTGSRRDNPALRL
jgi:hypothetical protein